MTVSQPASRPLERFLAVTGLVVCLAVTIAVFLVFGRMQPMWPLPGLYLLEMLLLSAAVTFGVFFLPRPAGALIGAALGAMGAFALLAAWTVGGLYLPVLLLLGAGGIVSLRRGRGRTWPVLAAAVGAALAQTALILGVVRLFYP
jgi:hypothetical protein